VSVYKCVGRVNVCEYPQCIEFESIGSLSPNDRADQSSLREHFNYVVIPKATTTYIIVDDFTSM
jgi:hypothetical protein